MLVLGGSLFVGRAIAAAGVRAGWDVTTFNRGRSAPDLPGVSAVRGDRTDLDSVAQLDEPRTVGCRGRHLELCATQHPGRGTSA